MIVLVCLNIICICCLIALEMYGKVSQYLRSQLSYLFLRFSSMGQEFKFRELYHVLRIPSCLSTFRLFSHHVLKGLYYSCLNETKDLGMEIQQNHYRTQVSISAKD